MPPLYLRATTFLKDEELYGLRFDTNVFPYLLENDLSGRFCWVPDALSLNEVLEPYEKRTG